jgi:ribosome-associated protein
MSGRPRRAGLSADLSAERKASLARAALLDRRALEPVMLDMREVTLITDYFLICHGTSNVHIRALADGVAEALKQADVLPLGVEGAAAAQWVLLDYGDLIVHIFAEDERRFYDLERLWDDAPRVEEPPHDE